MAGSDRRNVASILARARRIALDIEARTSLVPLPGPPPPGEDVDRLALYDALITDGSLRQATHRLYRNGHFAEAVEAAYKVVNNTVKKKAGTPDKDGTPMMQAVFAREKPILRLNALRTETERNEQEGYRFIFAGAMLGIRNPRAHEHEVADEAAVAIEMLVLANHLLRVLDRAVRPRKKKEDGPTPAPERNLQRATAADERRIADATEQIDRCSAMVAARVAYAAMWHRGGRWQPLKEERLALERRHPLDLPPTVLEGMPAWDAYVETEKRLRHDTVTPREDRAKEIERAGAVVLRLLGTTRSNLRA
jgi:uncharacterized protein (TIGR02391 family)